MRHRVLHVDMPRWTAQMMDLGLYDDIDTYRPRIGGLATA